MKVRHWALLSIASLAFVGCIGAADRNPVAESSITATTNPSTPTEQTTAIAQSAKSAKAKPVSSGSFASGEHPTQGTARIVTENGKFFLELDQGFKTSDMGPDLVVALHRSSNVLGSTKPPAYPLKQGDYVVLAPLQKFSGAQRYAIPATVKLADYKSAVVWCRKFNATFGAAKLNQQ